MPQFQPPLPVLTLEVDTEPKPKPPATPKKPEGDDATACKTQANPPNKTGQRIVIEKKEKESFCICAR